MRQSDKFAAAFQSISRFANILTPEEADEPILAPAVRAAIYEWLIEIRNREELAAVGVKPRSTAVLYGPPGCGKTTLAHHLSARLGLPLVAVQSEQLVASELGGSQKNVANLFTALNDADGRCVVLLDEIDAIGGSRSKDDQACAREMNHVLTTLLQYVEGFKGICIAATNREESLDPALWRRFGLQLSVDLPGEEERFAIIRRYSFPYALTDDDIDILVTVTRGASPALLRSLIEGFKRTMIIAPKIGRQINSAYAAFAPVIAAVRPHPSYTPPELWTKDNAVDRLAKLSWPIERGM